jgi:glutamate synthase domain-containing protein 3
MLVALGCIYARQCHKNTCPVGIATQDPVLRAKYKGTVDEAVAYFTFIANDVRRRLAAIGARSLDEVHGRSDLLRQRTTLSDAHLAIDLSEILRLPETSSMPDAPAHAEAHIDDFPGSAVRTIRPADRAVGARLAHTVVTQRANGEPVSPVLRRYVGSAGQSFGAFLTEGIELELAGEANDYVGKSMEGGRIVIRGAGGHEEPAIGNASFYGARGGEAFVVGTAGERLAVRNSGATIVVDGAGDHACEYMTRGTVVILGPTGRNLASGMSGGTLYAFGSLDDIRKRLGPTECIVRALDVDSAEALVLSSLLERYADATDSSRARALLAQGPSSLAAFAVVASGAPAIVGASLAVAG